MFTGIIQKVGEISSIENRDGDWRLGITGLDMSDVALGDSIATSGVCLTVIEKLPLGFIADVSAETLKVTSLESFKVGTRVNLEKALTLQTPLGGHLVSGHVDGVGVVKEITQEARSWRFKIAAPKEIAHYIARKGSICVDGVSLTVNEVSAEYFDVNIVPHTLQETTIGDYELGSRVNLEVDLMARYLERLMSAPQELGQAESKISQEFLASHGFA